MRTHYSRLSFLAYLTFALTIFTCVPLEGSGLPESTYDGPPRTFSRGFESIDEFTSFYIVSDSEALSYGAEHELIGADASQSPMVNPVEGSFMHKAQILTANDSDNDSSSGYKPHRAYPTVQFHKTSEGIYRSPCLISLYVYLDMVLADLPPGQIDDWFSFITTTPDDSDNWNRTVLANVGPDHLLRLVHVPTQGQQQYRYQNSTLLFPQKQWVRLDLYIDYDPDHGEALLWQDGTLVSSALVEGGNSALAQAHFGLYASARVASGVIYNDKLRIREVADLTAAEALVSAGY
jgi:hypothetical protein